MVSQIALTLSLKLDLSNHNSHGAMEDLILQEKWTKTQSWSTNQNPKIISCDLQV